MHQDQITAAIQAAEKFCDDNNPEVSRLLARFHELNAMDDAPAEELIDVCTRIIELDNQFQTLCNHAEQLAERNAR